MPLTLKQRVGQWLFARLPVTRFLFDQIRAEVNAARVQASYVVLPWWRRRALRLRRLRSVLVNVACGPHVAEGFLNVDLLPSSPAVVAWDCRRSIPVSDAAAASVRVEHFLEHLEPREEVPVFLNDVHRALQPGGVLRVIVPDAKRYLEAYCRGDAGAFQELGVTDPFPADLPTRMDVVNHVFHQRHEHRWAYDFETLALRLQAAGFARVEQVGFGASLDPRLACDWREHAPYSLYVDAVK
jgi:predicted SAM-dependent methyltransferase